MGSAVGKKQAKGYNKIHPLCNEDITRQLKELKHSMEPELLEGEKASFRVYCLIRIHTYHEKGPQHRCYHEDSIPMLDVPGHTEKTLRGRGELILYPLRLMSKIHTRQFHSWITTTSLHMSLESTKLIPPPHPLFTCTHTRTRTPHTTHLAYPKCSRNIYTPSKTRKWVDTEASLTILV